MIKFKFDSSKPIYSQLTEQLRVAIIAGQILPGEKLPTVREFSASIRVNPNTLQRALGELEDEGLIFTERTNGKYVTQDEKRIDAAKKKFLQQKFKVFLADMERLGMQPHDIIKYIKKQGG